MSSTETDATKEIDALVFHVGYAFQEIMTDQNLYNQVFSTADINDFDVTLQALIAAHPNVGGLLNTEIRNSIGNHIIYPNGASDNIGQNYSDPNFDLVTEINNILDNQNIGEELVLYSLDEFHFSDASQQFNFGADILLPCNDEALVFDSNQDVSFISETGASQSVSPFLFIGVGEEVFAGPGDVECEEYLAGKWHHHAKIDWLDCSGDDCDIQYTWYNKKRWWKRWKKKNSGTLTQAGDSNYHYHSQYRIKCKVCWESIENFNLWHKHWSGDPWKLLH